MSNTPEKKFEPSRVARMVLDMRKEYAAYTGDRRRVWSALKKVRNGSYTDDYRRIPWKTRYKSNQGAVQIEHMKAIMLRNLPVPRAVSDDEAVLSTGLIDTANAALDVFASEIDYEGRFSDAIVDDTHTYGPAILKFLQPRNGKIRAMLCNLHNVFAHPLAEDLANCESIVEDMVLSTSEALRRYPAKRAEIMAEAAHGSGTTGMDGAGRSIYETPNDYDHTIGAISAQIPVALNTAVVLHEAFFRDSTVVEVHEEFFENIPNAEWADGKPKQKKSIRRKTQKKYPKGRHVVVTANGRMIADEQNYDPDGKFPYIMIGSYWRAHEFYPVGDLEFMAPSILLLDEVVSVIADAAKHHAYPSFAYDNKAGIDRNTIISRPNQWIPMNNPNLNLMPIKVPPMHDSVIGLHGILNANLNAASMPMETQGFRPRGDVTGKSIDAMASMAAIRPGMKHANYEVGMGEFFQRAFSYMTKYWRNKRLTVNPRAHGTAMRRVMQDPQDPANPNKMGTQTLDWDSKKMREADIRIIVEPGSSMPQNPEQEYQGLLSLYQLLLSISGGDFAKVKKIIPFSYIVAHSPLRNIQMVLQRTMQAEMEEAKAEGAQAAMQEEAQNMSLEELQAMAFGRAQGGVPSG